MNDESGYGLAYYRGYRGYILLVLFTIPPIVLYGLDLAPAVKLGQGKINLNYECNKPRLENLRHILLFFFKGDDFNVFPLSFRTRE
ncbi:unnamed protein product [Rhizophagus irregularis]|nr:unnamed protein product [Rhizophagus irregularis]